MTKFTLADAVDNISERQIHRTLSYRRRANKLLWFAPIAACLVIAVCLIPMLLNSTSTEPPVSNPVDSTDDKNPGGATNDNHYLSYNGEYFEFDHCVIRIVFDDNGRIIEPEKADWDAFTEETLKAADKLDALEYIGTGEVIGTDPNAKLYIMPSGNILAVRPCIIEPYTDAEEMLAKYSRDHIFEIFTFIKVYDV
ncbi:MAG: hypothetical protein HDT43_02765 [Ruminococcaceae bacterium]|nr:hypothetical protein [Oscillospiraceae bacterium]